LLCCSLKNLADADSELVRRTLFSGDGRPGNGGGFLNAPVTRAGANVR
jgi:hypothetical protein